MHTPIIITTPFLSLWSSYSRLWSWMSSIKRQGIFWFLFSNGRDDSTGRSISMLRPFSHNVRFVFTSQRSSTHVTIIIKWPSSHFLHLAYFLSFSIFISSPPHLVKIAEQRKPNSIHAHQILSVASTQEASLISCKHGDLIHSPGIPFLLLYPQSE